MSSSPSETPGKDKGESDIHCEMIDDVLRWMLPGMPVDTGFPESRQSLYRAWEDHDLLRASFCSRLSDIFRLAMLPDMEAHPEAARLALFCIAAWQMDHMVPDMADILKNNHDRPEGAPEKRVFIPLDTLFAELEVPTEAFNLSQWVDRLGPSMASPVNKPTLSFN